MNDWKVIQLKDITELITKGTTPTSVGGKFNSHGGINFIKSESLNYEGIIDEACFELIDEETNQKLKRSILKENDILFSIAGIYLGKTGVVQEQHLPANTNQACGIIRLKHNEADYRFIKQYFCEKSFISYVNSLTGQAAQPNINLTDVRNLKLLLPPLPQQRRIASILYSYDKFIEVNNQRIKLLEETARNLYKEWFIRLRFPGYKQAKLLKGIPLEWQSKELREFGKIFTGKTPATSNKDFYNGNIPFIKTPDLHKGQFILNTEEYLTEKGSNTQKRSLLPKGSICVSCIGTGGIVGITTAEKSQTNQQINSLIPSDPLNLEFLFYAISDLKETIELYGYTGATMTNLSKGKFERLKILYPHKELVARFNHLIAPTFKQLLVLQQQNTQLRQIRDRLLPRLISGKLTIKNAVPENL